jgi:hypothetical protein
MNKELSEMSEKMKETLEKPVVAAEEEKKEEPAAKTDEDIEAAMAKS